MSWSFTLTFCGGASPRPLTRSRAHHPARAAQILRDLGLEAREQSRPILDDALGRLEPHHIAVGAYEDIVLFSDPGWLLGANDGEVFATVRESGSIPTDQVLYVQLAGVVSYQCYAYRIDGQLVRRLEADGDRLVDNTGAILPVERALWKTAAENAADFRVPELPGGTQEEGTDDEFGSLPFAMMSLFVGVDYTQWSGEEPVVSLFRVRRRTQGWRRLFSR